MKALILSASVLLCASVINAQFVTMVLPGTAPDQPSVWSTNQLILKDYEAAELVSFPLDFNNVNSSAGANLQIFKGGGRFFYYPSSRDNGGNSKPPLEPVIVTGPAIIHLVGTKGMCTFKITPEAYPPDKSAIVMPGTNGGARVTLEASTDLTNWAPATNGVYSNLPAAKFFRIAVERVK